MLIVVINCIVAVNATLKSPVHCDVLFLWKLGPTAKNMFEPSGAAFPYFCCPKCCIENIYVWIGIFQNSVTFEGMRAFWSVFKKWKYWFSFVFSNTAQPMGGGNLRDTIWGI